MSKDFQAFVDNFIAPACVLSVEKAGNGPHRTIRIVAGNRAYLDTIEKPVPGLNDHPKEFIPDLIYTNYIQEDVNFEQASYQAAVCHKKVSSYVHPDKFDFWFDMLFIPMPSDDEDLG
ncbi:MAG: GGDEF domain-containing protein, partial [Oscillospiraceae bacterium]|nr:GGDEF domain-containing protein [Oscillospiraceae bacterium]